MKKKLEKKNVTRIIPSTEHLHYVLLVLDYLLQNHPSEFGQVRMESTSLQLPRSEILRLLTSIGSSTLITSAEKATYRS